MDEQLSKVCDEYFQTLISSNPFTATVLGVRDVDDQVPDVTEAGQQALRTRYEAVLSGADAIDDTGLDQTDTVTRALLLVLAGNAIADIDARGDEFSASAFFTGPQAQVLSYVPKVVLTSPEQADAYVTRLGRIDSFLSAAADRLVAGVKNGRPSTARGVRDSITQIDRYLALPLEQDPLASPAPPLGWDGADAWQLRRAGVITDEVRPAMQRLRDRLETEVLPAGRDDEHGGLRWLPEGDALYAHALRTHTTTGLTPAEIHALGLQTIDRLADEYRTLGARVLDTDDLPDIFKRLRSDDSLRYSNPQDAVTAAEEAVARATAAVPYWFGRVPAKGCDVKAMPEVEARGMTVAYYQPPAQDGTADGVYWINTVGPVVTRYEAECVAFHEALPGHHLQIAIAQKLDGLPPFRRLGIGFTAYTEGWGLYTERLADEMGLYSGDLDRIGMLSCDSLRACRLVVDTGLHHLGWSRQQAIDYMLANSPLAEAFIVAEVDRYIVLPGQATGYMVGRIEIERLRREAQQTMGARFDIKGFHDTVLGNGSLPLTVLNDIVQAWAAA